MSTKAYMIFMPVEVESERKPLRGKRSIYTHPKYAEWKKYIAEKIPIYFGEIRNVDMHLLAMHFFLKSSKNDLTRLYAAMEDALVANDILRTDKSSGVASQWTSHTIGEKVGVSILIILKEKGNDVSEKEKLKYLCKWIENIDDLD